MNNLTASSVTCLNHCNASPKQSFKALGGNPLPNGTSMPTLMKLGVLEIKYEPRVPYANNAFQLLPYYYISWTL